MKIKKVCKSFVDHGLGFPIQLFNVPMVKVRGTWTPKIDYNRLSKAVLEALSSKPGRLTGNEIRFIRLHFEMTLQEFAKRFTVSHAAVIKWEKMKDKPTMMHWSTEKDMRLYVLSKLNSKPKDLAELYNSLESFDGIKSNLVETISLDVESLAA